MATVVHVCKTKTLLGWFLHAFTFLQVEEKVKPAAKILNSDNRMLEHFKQQQSIKFPFVG